MDYKELGIVVVALTAFIIFYKRFLQRDGDKPHKPAVLIISALMLAGVYNANRPFLDRHGGDILSIVVCLLAALVFMDIYESADKETPLTQIFRIDTTGAITQH